jgi:hypothetical protein
MRLARHLVPLVLCALLTLSLSGRVVGAAVQQGGASPALPRNLLGLPVSGGGESLAPLRTTALGPFPDVQVDVDPGNLKNDFGPAVAVSRSGAIYVVWAGDETQKSIFFSRSTNGGATFSPAVRINDAVAYPPGYSVYQPDIALDASGNVYVVWFDYRAWADDNAYTSPINIFLDKSADGGVTWGTDVQATANGSGYYPWHFQPYLAVDQHNGNLYVSFTDYPVGDPGDVCVVRSVDHGLTFGPKVRVDDIADPGLVRQIWSAIAVDSLSGSVYVAFEDGRGSSNDIYLARSTDYGLSFGANHRVNADTTGIQQSPAVAVDRSGNVCAVWLDWRDDADPTTAPYLDNIRFARSTPGGAAFGGAVTVTDQYMNADWGYDFPPRIATDGIGGVHVLWFDRRADTTFCYYDHSSDGGLTFSADVVVHDNRDPVSHSLPRIALSAMVNPVVTWMDRRNGNDMFDVFVNHRNPVTAVGDGAPPSGWLVRSYPNPSRASTSVRYAVAAAANVRLEVCDMQGRVVRTLMDGWQAPGTYTVRWDGADASGRPAPCGVYFCRLRAGALAMQGKTVLVR